MSDGRTYWWAKDAAWWRRERIIALGLEFGSDGPAVIDWLSCEAKAQNDGGIVKTGRRAIAHGTFVNLDTVGHVLSRAVALGLLDELTEDANGVLTCRISGWAKDQERGRAAARKAEQRARDAETPDEHEGSPPVALPTPAPLSRPVTPRHAESPTGQDRREELPPDPPKGGRDRDRAAFDELMRGWAHRHFPGVTPGLVAAAVARLRSRDLDPTPENVRHLAVTLPQFADLASDQQAAPAA